MAALRIAAVAAAALVLAAPAAAAAPISATTSLEPAHALFGDRITAVATVVVDRAAVDPDVVHAVAGFGPLDLLAGPVVERERRGGTTVVRFRWEVACLNEDCVPSAKPHPVVLPKLRVTGGSAAIAVSWPALSIAGRVTKKEAAAVTPPFRLETELPQPTYRAAPGALAALLWGIAAALVLGAGLLAARELVHRRQRRKEERFALLSPLERALLLAREAERRGPADRRRALGLLARVLGTTESRLGGSTGELAWSPHEPSPEQVEAVVGAVELEITE